MARRKPSRLNVLKYGNQLATLRANMPRKEWNAFAAYAAKHGYTLAGAASGAPDALKERTVASLRAEALKTISSAYAPAQAELDSRQRAAGYLADKRRRDEASYEQWLAGENGKMDAQARAADATLQTTQKQIADEADAARTAAQADSAARLQASPGNVSSPAQSAALQQVSQAGGAQSSAREAALREAAAGAVSAAEDERQIAHSGMLAGNSARRAQEEAANQATINDIFKARGDLSAKRAQDFTSVLGQLKQQNTSNLLQSQQNDLAAAELGVKQDTLQSNIAIAAQKFDLETKKFKLSQWEAKHRDLTDQAKVQLGYDQIKAQKGQHEADRQLRKWIARYNAHQKVVQQDKKQGVTKDERRAYGDVKTAYGILNRFHTTHSGKNPEQARQALRDMGVSDAVIDVAVALFNSGGKINGQVRKAGRRAGILHIGYFFG